MSADVVLQWNFSPARYFEEMVDTVCRGHMMTIADSKVETKIKAEIFAADPSLREKLHNCLNTQFLVQELFTHKPYTLSKPVKTIVHEDGRKEYFLELEPATLRVTGGLVEFRVMDKNGRTIADSRGERVETIKRFREQVIPHTVDKLLPVLLQSYDAAVKDPNDELVHLYEIRDALSTKFGSEANAKAALGIAHTKWTRLGQLCNHLPLNQGRHRGKKAAEVLRDARADELAEARVIARTMVEAYVRYLSSR
jgi:hypothetical protein